MSALRTPRPWWLPLLLVLSACVAGEDAGLPQPVGDPVPEPPSGRPDPLDYGALASDQAAPETVFEGLRADAGGPAGQTLWGYNLDRPDPRAETQVDASGGFALQLPIDSGEVLRVVVVDDAGLRSRPVDLRALDPGGPYVQVQRPECLDVPRELVLDGAGQGELVVANDCGQDVPVTASQLRTGSGDPAVQTPPAVLVDGETTRLSVSTTDPDGVDAIWLIEVEIEGASQRYAVSVFTQ